jgi:hypothetical protein
LTGAPGHVCGFAPSVYLHSGVVRPAGLQLRKPLTCPAYGLDEMRVLGVGLYLAADMLDVYVRATGLTVEVAAPEVRDDVLPMVHLPRVGGQQPPTCSARSSTATTPALRTASGGFWVASLRTSQTTRRGKNELRSRGSELVADSDEEYPRPETRGSRRTTGGPGRVSSGWSLWPVSSISGAASC